MHIPAENKKNKSSYSKICKHLNDKIYNDNIKCVSLIITDFINFLISMNILDNATVVLVGDHLAMSMTPELNDKYLPGHSQHSRTIFNYIFTKQNYKKNRDIVFHFDFLPTILHTLNFKFDDNRYGLGASGFGNLSETFVMHKIDDFGNFVFFCMTFHVGNRNGHNLRPACPFELIPRRFCAIFRGDAFWIVTNILL